MKISSIPDLQKITNRIKKILLLGAQKALDVTTPIIKQVRQAVGIREFGD